MRILALECSGLRGAAAVAEGDRLLSVREVPATQRTAQGLAPAIAAALTSVQWQPRDIQLVAATIGPGSFTGLRVGIATAKALAYATGAAVLGIDTLETIAAQVPHASGLVHVVLDAQRRQLFAASFESTADGIIRTVEPVAIIDEQAWLDALPAQALVTGPGLTRLRQRLRADVRVVDAELWEPTAASVARRAWLAYQAGARDDVWRLLPRYYRPSAAEERHPQA